jgi:hypothetical protein
MPTKAEFLMVIEKAYAREKGRVNEEYKRGLLQAQTSTPLFGYLPPRWMLDFAATCAFLYARQGDLQLALQAKEALLFYGEWVKNLPAGAVNQRPEYADGIPPLEPVFHPVIFAPVVQSIMSVLSSTELECLASILADSLRSIWRFPEWGGHNRAMLRAAGLAQAAAIFPNT